MTLADRRGLLGAVLDTLVPAGHGFPSAGEIALDHVLAAAASTPALGSLLADGLVRIETAAGADFAALGPDERETVLRCVESEHPAFFDVLVRRTYDGYYSHPAVVARLGLDPGPIHPRGHRLDTTDLPDLSRIQARGRLYR